MFYIITLSLFLVVFLLHNKMPFLAQVSPSLVIPSSHLGLIDLAQYSPVDKWMLRTNVDDFVIRMWDTNSGKELQVLLGHTDGVHSAVFSPDGNYILTTGSDHKTILWDVASGKALYTRLQFIDNDWLVYNEHYRFDGTSAHEIEALSKQDERCKLMNK